MGNTETHYDRGVEHQSQEKQFIWVSELKNGAVCGLRPIIQIELLCFTFKAICSGLSHMSKSIMFCL